MQDALPAESDHASGCDAQSVNLHPHLFDPSAQSHGDEQQDTDFRLRDLSADVPVFYINLKRARDRRERMEAQSKAFCLRTTRVEAIDAARHDSCSIVALATENGYLHRSWADVLARSNKYGSKTFVCEMACLLSHLSALDQFCSQSSDDDRKQDDSSDDDVGLFVEDDVSFEYAVSHWSTKTLLVDTKAPLRTLFEHAEQSAEQPLVLHLALSSVRHEWLAEHVASAAGASIDDVFCFIRRRLPVMFGAVAYAMRRTTARQMLDLFREQQVPPPTRRTVRHESDWAMIERTEHVLRHLQVLPPPLTMVCLNDSFIHAKHNSKHVRSKQILFSVTWLRCAECLRRLKATNAERSMARVPLQQRTEQRKEQRSDRSSAFQLRRLQLLQEKRLTMCLDNNGLRLQSLKATTRRRVIDDDDEDDVFVASDTVV